MSDVVEIRYARPGLVELGFSLLGVGIAVLAGCGVAAFGVGIAFFTPPGGGVLRYALGAFFGCFGLAGVGVGFYWLRGIATLYLDRSVKLSLTDDELIDHRGTARRAVRWAEIRRVDLGFVTVNAVRHSALIRLTLEGGKEINVEVVGLDLDAETIRDMIDRRISRAEAADPYMHCHACTGERVRWETLAGGKGRVQTSCPACQGTGMLPNPKHAAAEAARQRCPACGGLSPVAVKACYHCAAPLVGR